MRELYKTLVNGKEIDIAIVYNVHDSIQYPYEIVFTEHDVYVGGKVAWMYTKDPDPKCDQAVIVGSETTNFTRISLNINEINALYGPTTIAGSYTWLTTNINNSVNFKDFMEHTINLKVYNV
jgi:hypothetical protein